MFHLQETDSWNVNEVEEVRYGWDGGKTAIVCPSHERCTAVLIGSLMIRSISVPHGGCDEEDFIA